jgi:MtaA/CmuA family methyltransferase
MTSYERVMGTFSGKKPDRVPILPVVREWCCKQAGIKFSHTMENVEKHVYSQYYCARKFGYDVVWGLIGASEESEAMGSVVKYGDDYLPTVKEHAVKDYKEDLPKLRIPNPYRDGRLPLILEGIRRLKELCGGEIPVIGSVQGPFRHAAMLRGSDTLMRDLFKNRESAVRLMEIATDSLIVWGVAVVQAGADIVWIPDPVASGDVVSPRTYKEWVLPFTKRLVEAIKKTGTRIIMHVCGDTSDRLEILASSGVDGLSLDAKVDFGFARRTLGPNYLLMGNVEPTSLLTVGTPKEVYEYSKELIERAGSGGHFFLSSGCIVSSEAPAENMEAMFRAGQEAIY